MKPTKQDLIRIATILYGEGKIFDATMYRLEHDKGQWELTEVKNG